MCGLFILHLLYIECFFFFLPILYWNYGLLLVECRNPMSVSDTAHIFFQICHIPVNLVCDIFFVEQKSLIFIKSNWLFWPYALYLWAKKLY